MNQTGCAFQDLKAPPAELAALLGMAGQGEINLNTAKAVLNEMLKTGKTARSITEARGLQQISDTDAISALVEKTLLEHPQELANYLNGKETLANWFFGQVMRSAGGKANPQVVRAELERQLAQRK
jgi:aspartyl-tRNA(Asn)/glutamyl-tRNA(Gln) amidotransferase subunit B